MEMMNIKIENAIEHSLNAIDKNIDYFTSGFPHVSSNGIYQQEDNKLWTASFFPGTTYLAYSHTRDRKYLRMNRFYLDSFRDRCISGHMSTHDIGFLFMLTYAYEYTIKPTVELLEVIVSAANALIKRYNSNGKYIQAWGEIDTSDNKTQIIIDCMMNLEFLFFTSEITGDDLYKRVAVEHAKTSSMTLVRPDGSTYHTYYIDTQTGAYLYGETHQGNRNESTWARGQAWSIYGFVKAYEGSNDPYFLSVARRSAEFYISNLPEDKINYWDFDFNDDKKDIRDTSASAIAICGLLKLGKLIGEPLYISEAKRILNKLIDDYMNIDQNKGSGLIREGMYHRDHGFNEYTSWGDYYFFEALLMMKDFG